MRQTRFRDVPDRAQRHLRCRKAKQASDDRAIDGPRQMQCAPKQREGDTEHAEGIEAAPIEQSRPPELPCLDRGDQNIESECRDLHFGRSEADKPEQGKIASGAGLAHGRIKQGSDGNRTRKQEIAHAAHSIPDRAPLEIQDGKDDAIRELGREWPVLEYAVAHRCDGNVFSWSVADGLVSSPNHVSRPSARLGATCASGA